MTAGRISTENSPKQSFLKCISHWHELTQQFIRVKSARYQTSVIVLHMCVIFNKTTSGGTCLLRRHFSRGCLGVLIVTNGGDSNPVQVLDAMALINRPRTKEVMPTAAAAFIKRITGTKSTLPTVCLHSNPLGRTKHANTSSPSWNLS